MARTPATFKEADVKRVWNAARSAGLDVVRTVVGPDGTITVFHTDCSPVPQSPYDEWRAKKNARSS